MHLHLFHKSGRNLAFFFFCPTLFGSREHKQYELIQYQKRATFSHWAAHMAHDTKKKMISAEYGYVIMLYVSFLLLLPHCTLAGNSGLNYCIITKIHTAEIWYALSSFNNAALKVSCSLFFFLFPPCPLTLTPSAAVSPCISNTRHWFYGKVTL